MVVDVNWFIKNIKSKDSNSGEGSGLKGFEKFIKESDIYIYQSMVCVAHDKNTVSKQQWLRKDYDDNTIQKQMLPEIQSHLDILSKLNI